MITIAAFVVAAGIGAVLRYVATVRLPGSPLPWGTLAVNLAGSFVLGVVAAWSPPAATVVGTAGLGALTTYSTFIGELVAGWRTDRTAAAVYATASLGGGIALAWWGLVIGGA